MLEADFVKVAKALADPTRYRMLQDLRRAGELTCSCMCNRFPLSQPTISHHIKTLEEAGLIQIRKDGPYHVLTVNETLLTAFTRDLAEPGGRPAAAPASPPRRKARRRKTLS